jgi:hypothetical protein
LDLERSEDHEVAFRTLQGLVIIHLVGVAFETWKAKDAPVPAMITGRKRPRGRRARKRCTSRGRSPPADRAFARRRGCPRADGCTRKRGEYTRRRGTRK